MFHGADIVCFVSARGRVNVARLLLDMLPPELAAISTPEERAAEYLDYRQFFIAWETVERVIECQTLEAPQMSRDTRATWLKDYGVRALFFVIIGVSQVVEYRAWCLVRGS
jgi:nuclear pore complex protein Nup107